MTIRRAFLVEGIEPTTTAPVNEAPGLSPRERDVRDYARMTAAERTRLERTDRVAHERMHGAWLAAGSPAAQRPAGGAK